MFLIPLRPCKCSSFHNLSGHMHGIQLSREFEATSTSIRRVDLFATHVACVAGGISAGLHPRFAWWFRVAAKKVPRAQESHQLRRLQHTRIAVRIYLLEFCIVFKL